MPYISPPFDSYPAAGKDHGVDQAFWFQKSYGQGLMWLWLLMNALLKRRAIPGRQVQLSLLPDGSWTEAARVSIIFGIRRVFRESCPFIAD